MDEEGETVVHETLWHHLGVVRTYFLIGATFFVIVSSLLFFYDNDTITQYLLAPLKGQKIYFLSPLEPFLFKFRIAMYASALISFPLWLFLTLRFVSPAIPQAKRRLILFFVFLASVMGLLSIAATYFYLLPTTLFVLNGFVVPQTTLIITAQSYMTFFLLEFLMVFVIFELPVVMVICSYLHVLNPYALARQRRYLYLGIIIALAIITPTTDALTLIIVTIPTLILAELGIQLSKLMYTL